MFDDVPGYVDSSWDDTQSGMVGNSGTTPPDAAATMRMAAVIIAVALVALWALGYWFKKG